MSLKYPTQPKHFQQGIPHVDVKKSILELRRIYPEMSNLEFSKWYSKKYKVKAGIVLRILVQDGAKDVKS